MEIFVIAVVAAFVIWWFFLRDPLDAGTKETQVAPYKVESTPVVAPEPVVEPVVQAAAADVDTVIVTSEAVAPTLVVDTISTELAPAAKKARPAAVKKTAGTRPAVKKVAPVAPVAKTATKPAARTAKPRVKKV
jgi:hypothetical protein